MKKTHIFFIILIVLELIIAGYIYLDNSGCKSPCEFHPSFLVPFEPRDFVESEMCIMRCDSFLPSSFYVVADLLILTVAVYIIYFIFQARKWKRK